jgi:hypothetical protein
MREAQEGIAEVQAGIAEVKSSRALALAIYLQFGYMIATLPPIPEFDPGMHAP